MPATAKITTRDKNGVRKKRDYTNRGKGLAPSDRPTKKNAITGNQYQSTPKQKAFMQAWLEPTSPTFGNAYQSAIDAGYSEHYAKNITSQAPDWLTDYLEKTTLGDEHITQAIQDLVTNPKSYNNAKSPADTRLKALELLAKLKGMLVNRHEVNQQVLRVDLTGITEANKRKL